MQRLELQAAPRSVFGKRVKRLRKEGIVPANIFGHGQSRAIQVPRRALEHLLASGGRSAVVTIGLDGGQGQTTLLKSFQRHPVTGYVVHADFQAVSLDERVTATVPVRFTGEAPAVRLGGVLIHPTTELKIEALARDLPEAVEVDLSGLEEIGSSVRIGDLTAPEGVTLLDPAEEVLASVQAPKVEVVEEPELTPEEQAEAAAEGEVPEEAAAAPSAETVSAEEATADQQS